MWWFAARAAVASSYATLAVSDTRTAEAVAIPYALVVATVAIVDWVWAHKRKA